MDDFGFYISLGKSHILDPNGYDHILFIIALCVVYSVKDWKSIAWLVTAFTIGHSVTLALATLKIIIVKTTWVEFLIPVTILITCITNFLYDSSNDHHKLGMQRYIVALFFGLIHGLGFSNFLRSILGREETIFLPLLYFNLGLELGQLIVVFVLLLVSYVSITMIKIKQQYWIQVISVMIAIVALALLWKNSVF